MKQIKILTFVVIVLFASVLVSCGPGAAQVAKGWAGTAFHDGIIYAGTADGNVVAINISNEEMQWSRPILAESTGGMACGPAVVSAAIYTTPIVHGDLVYVGTYSGRVYALTIDRGSERWIYPRTGSIGAIVGDAVIANETIYISSSDSMVYALDTTYGDLKWKSEILDENDKRHEKLWTAPVVHDAAVYVSTFDGHIYSLSAETGVQGWSFKSEAGFASSPVIYEDTIYVGSFDRHLYAIEIGSDEPMWRFPQEKPAGNWFWATPEVAEGIIYAGCLDGTLYAIDAKTGEEKWSHKVQDERGKPSPIVSSPVLTESKLIVVNESGMVYIFDPGVEVGGKATLLKTISIGADVKSSFCAQEGLVYIRDEDNVLHVVDIDMGTVSWKLDLTKKE